MLLKKIIILLIIWMGQSSSKIFSYEEIRQEVINAEELLQLGGHTYLNPQEKLVDNILKNIKTKEIDNGIKNPQEYAPALHFFKAKPLIHKSEVFKFIQQMPKGAVLHAHNTAMVSSEWVIKNLTYMPGLRYCIDDKGVVKLSFREIKCRDQQLLSVMRDNTNMTSVSDFDKYLEQQINLYTDKPEVEYSSINIVWNKFQNMFSTVNDLLTYIPAYKKYHYQLLQELYDDNIMYTEIRASFPYLYDEQGVVHDYMETAKILYDVVQNFRNDHPDFLGVKVIFSTSRNTNKETIDAKIKTFQKLHEEYPNFVIGFDLVGQEDLGKPLIDFLAELKTLPAGGKCFFHAGETNWYGTSVDFNILDAILLNTSRIGHGFALIKHPILWNIVKSKGIAVEINPISNQVLRLVNDLRNHPGSFYVSENIPIVISNDDPGFWNAKGLSYDFYYAFMAFSSYDSGLQVLKQLAWNSIRYSVLSGSEQKLAVETFKTKWNSFLKNVIAGKVVNIK